MSEDIVSRLQASGEKRHVLLRQDECLEAAALITSLRSEHKQEHDIVARIWKQLGSPTYEQLDGRSIYDLIDELKNRAEVAEAALAKAKAETIEDLRKWCLGRQKTYHDNQYSLKAAQAERANYIRGIRDGFNEVIEHFDTLLYTPSGGAKP